MIIKRLVVIISILAIAGQVQSTGISNTVIYNGGPHHTGVYDSPPVKTLTGVKWTYETMGDITSPPLLHDNTVYFGDWKGYFYALNATTGKEKWKLLAVEAAAGPPTISEGIAYWGFRTGDLYTLDAMTGRARPAGGKKKRLRGNGTASFPFICADYGSGHSQLFC